MLDFLHQLKKSPPMPRRSRIHIDGVPLHIVQRGHNRQPCFLAWDRLLANTWKATSMPIVKEVSFITV
jgi:REP element-mobilizing transposase RayT